MNMGKSYNIPTLPLAFDIESNILTTLLWTCFLIKVLHYHDKMR